MDRKFIIIRYSPKTLNKGNYLVIQARCAKFQRSADDVLGGWIGADASGAPLRQKEKNRGREREPDVERTEPFTQGSNGNGSADGKSSSFHFAAAAFLSSTHTGQLHWRNQVGESHELR